MTDTVAAATVDPAALVVATEAGAVRGTERAGLRSWRGIPYAAAPVGPLRFVRPQPVEPWEGERDAVEFGHAPPQHENKAVTLPPGITQDEDCLSLNVLSPAEGTGHPVMVWIHGGAYVAGSSAQPLFDGTHLVTEGDVVFVSLNYRLGALGFLDFTAHDDGRGGGAPLETNLGLRDTLAALQWVQQNIGAFGGDPDNVTLFGESAGGGCVTTLLTSPAAEGLFHRAIAESSPATSIYDAARAATVSKRFLELVGVDPSGPDGVEPLRRIDPAVLSEAAFALVGAVSADTPGTLAIAPTVDGDIVPVHPIQAYREGRQLAVPLIIGTNHDEASLFKLMKSPLMPITESAVHAMFEQLALEQPELLVDGAEKRIEGAYPRFPRRNSPAELSRDAGFRMPSIWLAAAHSRHAPTRMYRFDHAPLALRLLGIGATHGAEIAYVFGTLNLRRNDPSFKLGGLAEARALSAQVRARWLAFAQGDPDAAAADQEPWPLYDETRRATLVIDHGEKFVDDPDAAIRTAWGDEVIGFA